MRGNKAFGMLALMLVTVMIATGCQGTGAQQVQTTNPTVTNEFADLEEGLYLWEEDFEDIQPGMYLWEVVDRIGYPGVWIISETSMPSPPDYHMRYRLYDRRLAKVYFTYEEDTGEYFVRSVWIQEKDES